jgi:DNA modification methylase
LTLGEQIEENRKQAKDICNKTINYICGDSNLEINKLEQNFDFIFSCPPYFDLEVYSSNKSDLSNMSWQNFKKIYQSIVYQAVSTLKDDSFACFVIGNIRDEDGFYRNLISYTKECFTLSGMNLYNDIILLNSVGSASLRADPNFKYKKVTKTHQNVLVFFKGDIKNILNKKYLISY